MVLAGHHTKPLKEGKFSPGMWHPQQGDSDVPTYRDEQTHPRHLSGGDRGKGEDQDLGTGRTAQPGSCLLQGLQAGEERGFFLPRSGHQFYVNHGFVPAMLPGP